MTAAPSLRFDPNVRVRGNQTYVGYEDLLDGDLPGAAQTARLVEVESGLTGEGIVTAVDNDKRLIYVAVDWSRLRLPDGDDDDGLVLPDADPQPVSAGLLELVGKVRSGREVEAEIEPDDGDAAVELRLTIHPDRKFGRVTINGTQFSAEAAIEYIRAGDSLDDWVPDYLSAAQAALLEQLVYEIDGVGGDR